MPVRDCGIAASKPLLQSFLLLFLSFCWWVGPASAADKMYRLSGLPGINGVVSKGGNLFIALGQTSDTGLRDATMRRQLFKVGKSGGGGCKSSKMSEIGVTWTTLSCVNVTPKGAGAYAISLTSKFGFGKLSKDDIEFLKGEDFVRERRIELTLAISDSSCKAVVTKRSYKPLDGSAFKPSRTGGVGCTVERF